MRLVSCFLRAAAVLAITSAFSVACLAAAPVKHANSLPRASYIDVGAETSTPHGWLDFCSRYEAECSGGLSQSLDMEMNAQSWKLVREVNARVNAAISPLSDQDHWGVVDRWDLPLDGYGDCEDYVLQKRRLLIAAGLPRQALLVTVVKDEKGEGHAVLTVKTTRGEFVLDNMRSNIKAWSQTPYRFVKRQSQTDPNVWVQIGEPTSAPLTVAR